MYTKFQFNLKNLVQFNLTQIQRQFQVQIQILQSFSKGSKGSKNFQK